MDAQVSDDEALEHCHTLYITFPLLPPDIAKVYIPKTPKLPDSMKP